MNPPAPVRLTDPGPPEPPPRNPRVSADGARGAPRTGSSSVRVCPSCRQDGLPQPVRIRFPLYGEYPGVAYAPAGAIDLERQQRFVKAIEVSYSATAFHCPSICLRLQVVLGYSAKADRVCQTSRPVVSLAGPSNTSRGRMICEATTATQCKDGTSSICGQRLGWFPSARRWWAVMDLNQWPLRCQRSALTTELTAPDKNLSDLEAHSQARALETGIIDRHQTPEEPEDI